jgi:hypothetical protein
VDARTETADSPTGAPARPGPVPLPPLPEAINRLPLDGSLISGERLKQNRSLTFSWDAVPEATGYVFTLMAAEGNKEILRAGPQQATVFLLEDLSLLDAGPFVWRVEAVVEEGERDGSEKSGGIIRRGQAGENRFTLEIAPPGTPVLLKPGLLYGNN